MSEWGDKLLTEADNARLRAENDKLKHELELEKFRGAGEIEAYRREASVAVKHAAQTKAENRRLRELVRCLVNAEHPSDRATLIANAADMLAELGIEVAE